MLTPLLLSFRWLLLRSLTPELQLQLQLQLALEPRQLTARVGGGE